MFDSTLSSHTIYSRRAAVQAGTLGLLGLGVNHVQALRAFGHLGESRRTSCIYVFLSGGLSQHDSFDLKPDAPDNVRGEFAPIETQTPGIQICEHLPMLAQRSHLWSLVRSLTHPFNEHFEAHMVMLSGRTQLPPSFRSGKPQPNDWPSIAAITGDATVVDRNMPPAVVLPEILKNPGGQVASGQFAGEMGAHREPWFVEAAPFQGRNSTGAFPTYSFNHLKEAATDGSKLLFQAPNLRLPEGMHDGRLGNRVELLKTLEYQQRRLEQAASVAELDRHRQASISLLADPKVQHAFDVTNASDDIQDRYGRNSFGWSLLMARRLVDIGVNLVQVNLGNWNSWDTHGANFPKLKDFLLPPTDQALSALLDDLDESGQLDDTLIVVASEFGRTPRISHLPKFYKLPGRDHWGGAQSVLLAGGGVKGGRVIGSTDKLGAYPASDAQKPENLAATIYNALGIPSTAAWHDESDRPHQIYHGRPISGLT